ncbi:MAG: hypothetical protein ACJA2S_000639 [Cyclobacteriaceae bacterium]|jgi:hypothetical protein
MILWNPGKEVVTKPIDRMLPKRVKPTSEKGTKDIE